MKTKVTNFRLAPEAEDALRKEAERTGKTMTSVVEDLLLFRRIFADDAETAIKSLSRKHKLPPRRVVEVCVLKAAGREGTLPFDHLVAA